MAGELHRAARAGIAGLVLAVAALGPGCSGDDGGDDGGTAGADATGAPGATDVSGGATTAPAAGGGDTGLSLEGLAETADACPLDVAAAVEGAGLAPAGAATVEVETGSGQGGLDDTAVDRFGGTYVECRQPVDGGEVRAVVFATRQAGAFNLLLPEVMADLERSFDDADGLAGVAEGTEPGELIDLGPDTPVAAGVLAVEGAGSAVLYVDAADSPRPEQAQSIATRLLAQA